MSESMEVGCGGGGCGCREGSTPQDTVNEAEYLTEVERQPIGEFVLAALLTAYPSHDLSEHIHSIMLGIEAKAVGKDSDPSLSKISSLVKKWVAADHLKDLSAEYLNLFEQGTRRTSLHESGYGPAKDTTKKNTLAALAESYRAFSLEMGLAEDKREMVDHISVELEFYSLLLTKEARAKVENDDKGMGTIRETRSAFLRDHLGRFGKAIAESPEVARSPFYGPLFSWCQSLVDREVRQLGLSSIPQLQMPGPQQDESAKVGCCGGCS